MKWCVALVALVGCVSAPPPPEGRGRHWRELPDADQPGKLHGVDLAFDGMRKHVVLHGGVDIDGVATNATWALDEVQGRWDPICTAAAPPAVHAPALAYDSRTSRLVLVGGSSTADLMNPTNAVWSCGGEPGEGWVMVGTLPVSIAGAHLIDDRERGALLIVGGTGAMGTVGGDVYSSTDGVTWVSLGIAAPAQFGGSATTVTYDRVSNRILALKNYTQPYGTTPEPTDELWALGASATSWAKVCGPCTNEPRSEAAVVHLGTSNDLYVIGGLDGRRRQEYAGSWVFDNGEFVKAHDDPPARDHLAAAYNNDRQTVVVYGGNGSGCDGNCGTTWLMRLN